VLLGLHGLRVTEACETNIEDMDFEQGQSLVTPVGRLFSTADIQRRPADRIHSATRRGDARATHAS
jgi:hypothetical protein